MEAKNGNKHILNLAGEIDSSLENLLKEGGFTFVSAFDAEVGFVFVRNFNEPWESLGEKYQLVKKQIFIVSLSPVENKKDFWANNGRAILDEKLLQDPLTSKVVRRLFFTDSAVNIDYAYENLLSSVYTSKLHRHLNLGFHLDAIALKAFEHDFNVINLRSFYVNALSYLAYLNKAGICHFPVDIQYGHSDESFVLQFVVSSEKIYSEYLLSSLNSNLRENPVHSLLAYCEGQTDFFDIYELQSSGKLVMSGIWTKKTKVDFSSHFINNITSFSHKKREEEYLPLPLLSKAPSEAETLALEPKALPGSGIERLRALNQQNFDLDQASELLENLDFFSDDNSSENLTIKGRYDEDQSSQIVKGLKAEKEHSEIIKGSHQNEKESVTIIRGSGHNSENGSESVLVKGGGLASSRTFALPQEIGEKVDKDQWRQTRAELVNLLRIMTSEAKSFEEIEDVFVEKVVKDLSLYKEEARVFVRGVMGQMENLMVSREMEKRLIENKELLNKERGHVEFEKNEALKKSNEEIKKRESQILKMKRIIDAMKIELTATKKTLETYSKIDTSHEKDELRDENAKISEDKMLLAEDRRKLELMAKTLEGELALKNRELAKREMQIQSLKEGQQKQLERTNIMLKEYQDRIQELSSLPTSSLSKDEKEELEKFKTENQTLSSMIELSNKKISTLSETIDRIKRRGEDKFSQQIKNLSEAKIDLMTQLKAAQEREQDAEAKKRGLELALDKLQKDFDKIKENQSSAAGNEKVEEYETQIRELKTEEITNRQALKQSELSVKKLEQKVKFLSEQLAQAQKAGNSSSKSNAVDNSKTVDIKVKQLELVIEKNNIASSKLKDELGEKKKENLKLKTDLQTLQNQLQEAQRKLGILDKKKAA